MMERATDAARHLPYHELEEQLRQPGCAVCRLGAGAVRRYLESLCGEQVTDPQARKRWQEARGLCAGHAAQFDALAPRLTVAILYEDLVRQMERDLDGWAGPRPRPALPARCPACASAAQQEERSLRVLAGSIDAPELAEAYRASAGLCRTHTAALLTRLPAPSRRRVVAEDKERLQRLLHELGEVKRKHDYRFTGEPWGEEKSAPGRAVAKISGEW